MIRLANAGDLLDVYELICTLEDERFDMDDFSRTYEAQLREECLHLLVWCPESAQSPAQALLNMRIEPQLHHAAPVAEVQELVVDSSVRCQGVGKQLLDTAKRIARERGCVRLELLTGKMRRDAHRFYEREGLSQSHFGYTIDL